MAPESTRDCSYFRTVPLMSVLKSAILPRLTLTQATLWNPGDPDCSCAVAVLEPVKDSPANIRHRPAVNPKCFFMDYSPPGRNEFSYPGMSCDRGLAQIAAIRAAIDLGNTVGRSWRERRYANSATTSNQ